MNAFARIAAIVSADFRIRFRRTSTAVIFLLLCVAAYLWIPDPSTGRALLQINEQRALYDSAALGASTAILCSMLLLLFGFYMVSNAIRRDRETRTGFVLASTSMRNAEYIGGKFFGNVVFLSAIAAGYMLSSMVMQLVRGEAALQPLIFAKHYLIFLPPAIVTASVLALVFESIRFLSGRFGDLVYFFVWTFFVVMVVFAEVGHATWPAYTDPTGMVLFVDQVKEITGQTHVSIGASPFNTALPAIRFPGLDLGPEWLIRRIVSTLFAVPLLLLAWMLFPRFDPARIKIRAGHHRSSLLNRLNLLLKPLSAPLLAKLEGAGSGFFGSVWTETLLILKLQPAALVILSVVAIASVVSPAATIQSAFLPAICATLALLLADHATRENSRSLLPILFSVPSVKSGYVPWKLLSALLFSFLFICIPLIRLAFADAAAALSLLTGTIFICSMAVAFGVISGNPKAFVVTALLFLYICLNDPKNPGLDFAGWYGTATMGVRLTYAALAAAAIALAAAVHRIRLARRF